MRSEKSPLAVDLLAVEKIPLAVDLDGTLVRTDLLWECLVGLLKKKFLFLFLIPCWWFRGRAYLKQEIARRVVLDASRLPYNDELLRFLREEHERGRMLILTTASDRTIAAKVAAHLGIFSEILSSDSRRNMKGVEKAKALESRFGKYGFDYAGNERVDLKVWASSHAAIVVNARARVVEEAKNFALVSRVFQGKTKIPSALLRVIRAKHWVKNSLVFVPLITSQQLTQWALLLEAVYGFAAFCFVASSVYVLNDVADLDHDRRHHENRKRPFAAGDLSLAWGLLMIPLFLCGGLVFAALLLPVEFVSILIAYFVFNVAYSFYLKQVLLLDVLLLAIFYALRVFAGGVVTGIVLSQWLLLFSLFIFLSLAFAKRVSELQFLREQSREKTSGRGYIASDLEQLASLGAASGYIAVLVFALYLNAPEAKRLYDHPQVLWIVCPLLAYWISRLWLLVHRRQVPQDPIIFVLKDKVSYLIGLAIALTLTIAG